MEKMPADREDRWKSIVRRYGLPEGKRPVANPRPDSPLDALKREVLPPLPPSLRKREPR